MHEPVSQVLSRHDGDDVELRRHLLVSLGVHAAVVAGLLVGPGSWLGGAEEDVTSTMTIRLGGAEGPGVGGLTPMGGQPIQEVLTAEEAARPQWIQPPADTAPDVVLPDDSARRLEPTSEIDSAPDEARGRRLTRGPELREGTTMADTGTTGMGVGLSAGGLGGTSTEISLGDFCAPEYIATMVSLLRQRWDSNQQVPGSTVVRFSIHLDGSVDNVEVARSSGFLALDQSAQRAVLLTHQFPRLPSCLEWDVLTPSVTFEYRR